MGESVADFDGRAIDYGSAPGVAAGAALGSSPSIAVQAGSTDSVGQINITVGGSPTTGTVATVTFGDAFTVAPRAVTITPFGAALVSAQLRVSSISKTAFVVTAGNAPAAGTGDFVYTVTR